MFAAGPDGSPVSGSPVCEWIARDFSIVVAALRSGQYLIPEDQCSTLMRIGVKAARLALDELVLVRIQDPQLDGKQSRVRIESARDVSVRFGRHYVLNPEIARSITPDTRGQLAGGAAPTITDVVLGPATRQAISM